MSAKIIIVDDELDMLELLEMIISEKTPHQVVTTNNPLEVPRLMRQHNADLLITDLRMPAMGGIDLIQKVKEYYPEPSGHCHHRLRVLPVGGGVHCRRGLRLYHQTFPERADPDHPQPSLGMGRPEEGTGRFQRAA